MDEETFLKVWDDTVESHILKIKDFLLLCKPIGYDYKLNPSRNKSMEINPFKVASDTFYRENFHSDVIRELLDPHGSHKEGSLFLYLFIDAINNQDKTTIICKSDYQDVEVIREMNRIDVLIKSEKSKHCIILENKINNAGDMVRQIPRYYDVMIGKGFVVDRIIYLPLDVNKMPDKSDWSDTDKQHLDPLITIMPAFYINHFDMVHSWLVPCLAASTRFNSNAFIKQYIELIEFLNQNNMDNVILGKFYDLIINDADNKTSAESVVAMMGEIPAYISNRLLDHFKNNHAPFSNIGHFCSKNDLTFSGFKNKDNISIKLDVWSHLKGYDVLLSTLDENENIDMAKEYSMLPQIGRFTRYDNLLNKLTTHFPFEQEAEVKKFITTLLNDLRALDKK
jgi:hypothetical protein